MPRAARTADPGRPKGRPGLPPLKQTEAPSTIGQLRCCGKGSLTVEEAAQLMGVSKKCIYTQLNACKIPELFTGFEGIRRIDAAAWAEMLEKLNPHLIPSARRYQAA